MERSLIEESQVAALAGNGEDNAFAGIVNRYYIPIRSYIYHLTGDYEATQDLTQDTFLQAYKNIRTTENDLPLKAWLYRVATNNAWQYHRRKNLKSLVSFKGLRETNGTEDVHDHRDEDEDIAVQDALKKINGRQRTCLVLHYIEGFKYREIAETLGISEDSVRKRVARGKTTFLKNYNGEKEVIRS